MRFHKFNYVSAPWIVLPALCYLVCLVEICFVFFQEIVTNITCRKIRFIGSRILFYKALSYLYRIEKIFLCFAGLTLNGIESSHIITTHGKIRLIGIGVLFHKAFSYPYSSKIVFLCFVRLILVIIESTHIVITRRQIRLIGIGVLFHKAFSYPYRSEIVFLCFVGLTLIAI